MGSKLENFYKTWSVKDTIKIQHDVKSSKRKINQTIKTIPSLNQLKFKKIIDFGCGYGTFLHEFANHFQIEEAYGFDFSEEAISYAKQNYENDNIKYFKLSTLDNEENVKYIKEVAGDNIDCVFFIDLLEHIPDCISLLKQMSVLTNRFLIKLPLEDSIMDNYLSIRKKYPNANQGNGHLREFNVNNVHYFISKLGLVPIQDDYYIYHINDSFPPTIGKRGKILKFIKLCLFSLLPILRKKLFLRIIGGGGYITLATFDENLISNP